MKKIKPVFLALCLFLCACGGEAPAPPVSAGELTALLLQECGAEAPVISEKDQTLSLLGLEESVCSDAASFQAMDTAMPAQGYILLCCDAAGVKEAESALQSVLEERLEQSRAYSPADYAATQKCRVEVRGLWVSLFLGSAHREWEEFYASAFSGEPLPALRPTPEPTPAPTPEPTPSAMAEAHDPVDDSWFDDALFVGDSVADTMRIYVSYVRSTLMPDCMGKATFFCIQNFSFARAVDPNRQNLAGFPIYQGKARRVEDVVGLTGCKKLLIGMGANELSGYGAEKTVEHVQELMELCLEVNPELEIYLMNMTPSVYAERERGLDNRIIREYNALLLQLCEEKGYHYLDIYTAIADEGGLLPKEDCRDPYDAGIHPTGGACERWLNYLYTHCP